MGEIYKAKVLNSDKSLENAITSLKEKHEGTPFIEGTFDDSVINYENTKVEGKVNWNSLSTSQKRATVVLGQVGKRMGLDVELISDGYERGINGAFEISENKMLIDIYAGMDKVDGSKLQDAIIPTISHEMTHWMENKSPELYRKYDHYVMETLMMGGKTERQVLDDRLKKLNEAEKRRKAKYEAENPGKTYTMREYTDAEVRAEVIARASEDMFAKSEEIKKFLESLTETERKSIVAQIKEILQNIKDWLNDFLSNYKSTSDEAKIIRQYQDRIAEQIKLWDKMLISSIAANQALKKEGITGEKLANKTSNNVQEMARDRYWYPQMSNAELAYVRRIAKYELPKTDNYLDENTKWLYNVKNGNTYFALYSIADENEPTILYACKGTRAELEHQFLSKSFEKEVDNNGDIYSRTKIIESILGNYGYVISGANVGNGNVVGGRSNNRNVGVYSKNSRIRPSEALLNCLRNIREIQKRNEVTLYSDRDTLGNTLTEAQQSYFAESKVRDENGNLKVMYHGSPKTEDLYGYNCQLLIDGKKINIERPKIVYNEKTKKYIMWAHYENGSNYLDAAIALASSDTPDGDFVYHGFFRPFGHMSRDCNVFYENGKMYFASTSNQNADLHIYQMNDTYTGVDKLVQKAFVGKSREAPAFINLNDKTYVITSRCTGWLPNQGGYAFADNIESEWSEIFDFGDDTTYHSQSTAVLTLDINGETQYIYIGDRWGGNQWDGKNRRYFEYFNSSYYFSLIKTNNDGSIELIPCDEFTIDLNNGGFKIISQA